MNFDWPYVIGALVSVFLICGVGALLEGFKWLTEDLEKGMMRMVVNLFLPSYIIYKMLGSEEVRDPQVVSVAFLTGFGIVCVGFLIAYYVGKLFGFKVGSGLRSFTLGCGVHNYGFLAVPLMVVIYGEASNNVIGLSFVHGIGVEMAMWSVGLSVLSGKFEIQWRRLINGPTVGIVLGFVLVYTPLGNLIPEFLLRPMSMLGECTFPMALLLIGATMCRLLKEVQWDIKTIMGSVIVRNLLIPLVYLGVGLLIPADSVLRLVYVVQLTMPAAMMPILLAKHYGGNPDTSVQVVASSSLLSLISIPIWLMIGQWILLGG